VLLDAIDVNEGQDFVESDFEWPRDPPLGAFGSRS
jgi:hypothetical protein